MTIWRIETLDGWDQIMFINVYGCEKGYYDMQNDDDVEMQLKLFPSMAYDCKDSEPQGCAFQVA
jgi:hypothetical protein